ncbi:MAG: EAL domain-containing protein [Nitrospinae bacterium]|nr:EAL domain-containing protein [Nitrospinota bacterium]
MQVPLAILLLDLDRFRDVNDTLGFSVGDELLTAVARRLSDRLRVGDAVARLGGDEFLLFVHLAEDAGEAAVVAQRLLDSFALPFPVGDREIYVTATLGITLFPADGQGLDSTLRRAHMALADAKRAEPGGFRFYSPEMERQVALRQEIENNLMPGLERGEFSVHYQPKISTVDGRVVGLEALVRWNSPVSGMVPPSLFIPLAEERGFIVPLGAWVLRTAVAQAKAWLDQGFEELVVSVNLSGRQLANREIVTTVKETLAASGLPASLLELEVTETAVMADIERSLLVLEELAALGVNLSLDDFGSGYSSLSYLNRLPVNRIKIDREFVKEVGETTDDSVIARAAIAMGHTLGLLVIAEGAETVKQVSFLHDNGCDEIQGYYYSPPVPAERLQVMLAANGKRKPTSA